jgi:hypothetical protein
VGARGESSIIIFASSEVELVVIKATFEEGLKGLSNSDVNIL